MHCYVMPFVCEMHILNETNEFIKKEQVEKNIMFSLPHPRF